MDSLTLKKLQKRQAVQIGGDSSSDTLQTTDAAIVR